MQPDNLDRTVLAEIVQRLTEAIAPDRIILFGSRARGDFGPDSDVDLLIIKPSQEPSHRRVIPAYQALKDLNLPKDILWYTPEEIQDWSEVKYHVATRAIREGRVIYEKQS